MTNQRIEARAVRLAEEWGDRLSTIARNLTDFNESDAARRVLTRVRDGGYSGRTEAEATRAATALEGLWQDYLTLAAVVEKATITSKKIGFLTNRDEEVAALLEGPSVRLPAISVPVGRRNLLDPAETGATATPAEVLMSMKVAFAVARDSIAAVARAEDEMASRLAAIGARHDELDAWRTRTRIAIKGADPSEPIPSAVDRDPLAASDALAAAERALAIAEAERGKADIVLARLDTGFAAAEAALARIRDIDRESADARLEANTIDAGPRPVATGDETVGLSDWLTTLRRTASDGRLGPATIGLDKWNAAMADAEARAKAALAAARAPLDELADLRGRFRALRAKGATIRSELAVTIEAETKAELARVPVGLDAVRRLVRAYETALTRPDTSKGGPE